MTLTALPLPCTHTPTHTHTYTPLHPPAQAPRDPQRACQPAVHVLHLPVLPLPPHHHGHRLSGPGKSTLVVLQITVNKLTDQLTKCYFDVS